MPGGSRNGSRRSIVAADSAQLYEGLPILTNQSPAALVGIWQLDHEASVAEYQVLAHEAVDSALAGGLTPIVVGGTGLYLRAALADLSVPRLPRPALVSAGAPSTRRKGPSRHTPSSPSWTPPQRRSCTRTTVVVSSVLWNSPSRALAAWRPAVVGRHPVSNSGRGPRCPT